MQFALTATISLSFGYGRLVVRHLVSSKCRVRSEESAVILFNLTDFVRQWF